MKKIIITEEQYEKVFVKEQFPIGLPGIPSVGDIFSGVIDYFVDDISDAIDNSDIGLRYNPFSNSDSVNDYTPQQFNNLGYDEAIKYLLNPQTVYKDLNKFFDDVVNTYPNALGNLIENAFDLTYGVWVKVKEKVKELWDACDYHCWLDIASIAVLFLPPPAGFVASAALDGINAATYIFAEDPPQWGNAALTALGIIPVVGDLGSLFKFKKVADPTMGMIDDIGRALWKDGVKVADDLSEEALKKIYKKNLGGLSDKQILQMGEELLGFTNKINKSAKNIKNIEKTLESFNKLPKYKQAWVKEMFKNPRYIKFLNANGGDIIKTLKNVKRAKYATEMFSAAINMGLFVGLYVYDEEIGSWIGEKYAKVYEKTGMDIFGVFDGAGKPIQLEGSDAEKAAVLMDQYSEVKSHFKEYELETDKLQKYVDATEELDYWMNMTNFLVDPQWYWLDGEAGGQLGKDYWGGNDYYGPENPSSVVEKLIEKTKEVVNGTADKDLTYELSNIWSRFFQYLKYYIEMAGYRISRKNDVEVNPGLGGDYVKWEKGSKGNPENTNPRVFGDHISWNELEGKIDSFSNTPKIDDLDKVAIFTTGDPEERYKPLKEEIDALMEKIRNKDFEPMKEEYKKEIDRMKSLFTEERLYGNLITEACDNCNSALAYIAANDTCQKEASKTTWYKIQQGEESECLSAGYDLTRIYNNYIDSGNLKLKSYMSEAGCALKITPSTGIRSDKFMNLTLYEDDDGRYFIAYFKLAPDDGCKVGLLSHMSLCGVINCPTKERYYQSTKASNVPGLARPLAVTGSELTYIRWWGKWGSTARNEIDTYWLKFTNIDKLADKDGSGIDPNVNIEFTIPLTTHEVSYDIDLLGGAGILLSDPSDASSPCVNVNTFVKNMSALDIEDNKKVNLEDFIDQDLLK